MSSRDRRKSEKLDHNAPGIVTLTVPPHRLRAIFPEPTHNGPAAASAPLPRKNQDAPAKALHKHDPVSAATPAAPDTPSASQSTMAPPTEDEAAARKKGAKRSAAVAGMDGPASAGPGSASGDTATPASKARTKPGPKKKAKLDDGVEARAAAGAHKLGPKASMGAINAGLRALDRSGKPCRRWVKGGFQLKSFTGVQWEIPRWRAPPTLAARDEGHAAGEESASAATASADGSNKENDKAAKTKSKSKPGDAANGASAASAVDSTNSASGDATPSDVDMAQATSAVASPSVEPVTEAATPVAAAA